ncbi:MAG: tRNA 2-thiouridine(34) synthase MnmA [Verrucomicrobiales bacterium]
MRELVMARILSALSGGVDSSVATALLLEQGHEVVAAYMRNWINEENIAGDCPWQQDIEDAQAVADTLGVEFRVLNLMDDYRERVVTYLLGGYRGGITPNPDVMCNREMKFGVFLDYARTQGFDGIATGHYARIRRRDDGACDLLRGADPSKDQSYFLALLNQDQLAASYFPIGHLLKSEVRAEAVRFGLPNARKKDSQGICFIGDVKMSDFLRAFIDDDPGDIVDVSGRVLGRHRGLHLYTYGQRKGLGVASPVYKEAFVVVGKRPERNQLVVGLERPDTPGLHARRAVVGDLHWTRERFFDQARPLEAQPRYRHAGAPAFIEPWSGEGGGAPPRHDAVLVSWDEPQRALTPGQVCAFYDADVLLGGGFFQEIRLDAPIRSGS